MQYKTIVLELIQQMPEFHDRLRESRTLLPTLEHLASELKTAHEGWKGRLAQVNLDSNEAQIASEAMEIALKELEADLPPTSSPDADDPLSLDEAMAFLRGNSPPA